jgi:nicotinamide riboside transporter PnuC
MNIILFLDLFTCVGVIVSLNFVSKYYKAWILYMIASLTQIIVCTCGPKVIPGLGLMATILFFTGLRNYRNAKNLAKNKTIQG